MGQLSRAPQSPNAGISPELISALPKHTVRKTTTEQYISGWKSTSVIDTPMRKLEVLESIADGMVVLRDTAYNKGRADLSFVTLEYHQGQALASVLRGLEDPEAKAPAAPANGNGKGRP